MVLVTLSVLVALALALVLVFTLPHGGPSEPGGPDWHQWSTRACKLDGNGACSPEGSQTPPPEAADLAIRDREAQWQGDSSTKFANRKANPCFTKRWPTLADYERIRREPHAPMPSSPIVAWANGDEDHQLIVTKLDDGEPPGIGNERQDELERFSEGWAVITEWSDNPGQEAHWDPCASWLQ